MINTDCHAATTFLRGTVRMSAPSRIHDPIFLPLKSDQLAPIRRLLNGRARVTRLVL